MKTVVHLSIAVILCFSLSACSASVDSSKPFLVGGDISALTCLEEAGGVYRADDKPTDAMEIFTRAGWNCFRLRIFVEPNKRGIVVQDLPYVLALAKRIQSHGGRVLLDFHYSDTWADPAKQYKPAAWEDLDFDALEQQVEEYSASVIEAFQKEGVLPEIVQVGNEIHPGMLWPDGKLHIDEHPVEFQWKRLGRLLKAGVRGTRRPLKDGQSVRIMIHTATGAEWDKTQWFFDNLIEQKVPFDIIGLSYYPWWHGTLAELKDNLGKTAAYNKDIIVVETAYPHHDDFRRSGNDTKWTADRMAWPQTPQGQADFLQAVTKAVRQTPNGLGRGVIYWYPESIPIEGIHGWFNSAMALFDKEGNALPGLKALAANETK